MKKRFLLVGNNVNKGELFEVMDIISKDYDIKKLIRSGRFSIISRMFFLIIVTIYSIQIFSLSEIVEKINELFQAFQLLDSFLFLGTIVIILLTILLTLYGLISSLIEITNHSMDIKKYIKYIFSRNVPRVPLDIWRFIQGSVADIQMYNTARDLSARVDASSEVKYGVCYAGMPYYKTYCLDSIFIKWNLTSDKKSRFSCLRKIKDYLVIRRNYKKFLRKYQQNTIVAMAEQSYFKENNKHVEYSNSVFGMLFSSSYFKEEIERRNKKYSNKIKVNIKVGGEEKEKAIKEQLALEWMRMVLTPELFEIVIDENTPAIIELTDITYFSKRETRFEIVKKNIKGIRALRIPIKRYIALPEGGDALPRIIIENENNGENLEENLEVICIGGAEQNLALQHVVNCFRWTTDNQGKDIGFAENIWENVSKDGFLMGTEGLVYGVREQVIGRLLEDKGTSTKAEVYELDLPIENGGTIKFYGVYGYSAMASKVALCQLIYCLDSKMGEKKTSDFVPSEHIDKRIVLDYQLTKQDDCQIFKTPTGETWDKEDLMNNVNKLYRWLSSEDNEIEAV